MDPPVYGKGDKKQIWRIENDLPELLLRLKSLLSDTPIAVVLNGYASIYTAHTYQNLLHSVFKKGKFSCGELCIKESGEGRTLSAGIFARVEF